MQHLLKVALAVATVGCLGAGGYFANRSLQCAKMEDDFVNAIAGLNSTGALRAISRNDPKLEQAANIIDKQRKRQADDTIVRIAQECGERDAQTAIRKAGESIGL